MSITYMTARRTLRAWQGLTPVEQRVVSRWYNRTPLAQLVRLSLQRGGEFYLVRGGRA